MSFAADLTMGGGSYIYIYVQQFVQKFNYVWGFRLDVSLLLLCIFRLLLLSRLVFSLSFPMRVSPRHVRARSRVVGYKEYRQEYHESLQSFDKFIKGMENSLPLRP